MSENAYKNYKNEITDWDIQAYKNLTAAELTPKQIKTITHPEKKYERQKTVLAVHWHPEIVPIELVKKRIQHMYPNKSNELIIPTQHNKLMTYKEYTGVEVDCYSPEFNRKVQLLLHFKNENIENADVLKSMLYHTFKYRQTQLFEFIETIINPKFEDKLNEAAESRGADEELLGFIKTYTKKMKKMIDENYSQTPESAIKNKLLTNYFSMLKEHFDPHFVHMAEILLKKIKKIVKKYFVLDYFYKTEEIIEETRALGGTVVVPHPEQFWPILLADYDVDGYEVWNPQSREYTEFLINVVMKKNKNKYYKNKPLLIFMGDDTHLGEKLKEPQFQKKEKADREIGYQPAWEDPSIRKSLILGNFDRDKIISEYKDRLNN